MYQNIFTLLEAEVHFLCALYQQPTKSALTGNVCLYKAYMHFIYSVIVISTVQPFRFVPFMVLPVDLRLIC
jgi:hypothetical protein